MEASAEPSLSAGMSEEIKEEIQIVQDLLEVTRIKPLLIRVALLHAIMTLEKSLRFLLKKDYKSISKIKFSVLIDKAQQRGFFSKEAADQLRILKNLRNLTTHQAVIFIEEENVLDTIQFVLRTIYNLFERPE